MCWVQNRFRDQKVFLLETVHCRTIVIMIGIDKYKYNLDYREQEKICFTGTSIP